MADSGRDRTDQRGPQTGKEDAESEGMGLGEALQHAEARPMAYDGSGIAESADGDGSWASKIGEDWAKTDQGGTGHPGSTAAAGGHEDVFGDGSGNRYHKSEILDIVLAYKKDSRNFFWGDLQKHCNKMCRKLDDRWYAWTREMMGNLDKNESRMRGIVHRHTHSAIQNICKDAGGELWQMRTVDKLKRLIGSVRQIEKLAKSRRGVETRWGRAKYMGAFGHRMDCYSRASRTKRPQKRLTEVLDYVEYKRSVWNRHYKEQEERDDAYKLYDRN